MTLWAGALLDFSRLEQCGMTDTKDVAATEGGQRRILRRLRAFLRDTSGNYAILSALLSPVLIGAAGLATEGGLWYHSHQTLQGAADSAALSAAAQYGLNVNANLTDQASSVVKTYGYEANVNGTTV